MNKIILNKIEIIQIIKINLNNIKIHLNNIN